MKTKKTGIRIDGKYVVKRGTEYYMTSITDKDKLDVTDKLEKYKKKVTQKVNRLLKSNEVSSEANVNFSTKRSKKKIARLTYSGG